MQVSVGLPRLSAFERSIFLLLLLFIPSQLVSRGQALAPGDSKSIDYVYNGQTFQLRILRGDVKGVFSQGAPVVMFFGARVLPAGGADPKLVATAQEAVKAYKAGQPSGAPATGANLSPASGAPASGLTVDGVIALAGAGITDDIIITKIQKSGQTFDLSTDDMIKLKKANVSDSVTKALMTGGPAAAPAQAQTFIPKASRFGGASPAPDTSSPSAPNAVAESPDMGKLKKKGGFMSQIGHGVSNAANGKTVIDELSMRNILPQWDPQRPISQQFPHIAITVLSAPDGWTEDYRVINRKNSNLPRCFKLKAVVWLDANRSKPTDDFDWCVSKDETMAELQPTYLFSLGNMHPEHGYTTGMDRTDGPAPPEKLLPNDRRTLDMYAKTNPQESGKDLNLDQLSLFAIMFANVRKDLGETLGSDGDSRVWVTTIKKASGPSLF